MKKQGRIIRILLLGLIAIGTLFSPVSKKVTAESVMKDIAIGTVYNIGDVVNFGTNVVYVDDGTETIKMVYTYSVIEPSWEQDAAGSWRWTVTLRQSYSEMHSLYFYSDGYTGNETVTGIKCVSGDGLDFPYSFELVYEAEAVTEYPLWVGDVHVTSQKLSDEDWSYDPESNMLTLENANITSTVEYQESRYNILTTEDMDLTIKLIGDNTVGNGNANYGILVGANIADGTLTVTGDGTLNVNAGRNAAIYTTSLVIDHTNVTVAANFHGFYVNDTITITGSTVNATGRSEQAIRTLFGNVVISDSEVTLNGVMFGIKQAYNGNVQPDGGKLQISGKSTVTAVASNDDGKAIHSTKIELDGVEIITPEEGFIGPWDDGSGEWETVYEENDVIAREAVFSYIEYTVASGKDATYVPDSNEDLVITVKRNRNDETCFERFRSVAIDGNELVKDTDYTAEKGSTVVTIKAAALDKLSEGKHTVTVEFDDGKAETSLTVKKASTPEPDPEPEPEPVPVRPFDVPKTGIEGPSSFRLIGLMGLCATVIIMKKYH
ncbi:MAG: carbohydrate-binding domain-containing protein [Erysipelotrichaceae bacterium]|nr:carbohydrate-binding domain-containing protein [Erysipelotrichaceae bacterium]